MPAPPETAVGVDVGGTHIRVGRVDRYGALTAHLVEPVQADRRGFADQVLRLVEMTRDETSIAVGVGIPGRVNPAAGDILSAGYLDIGGLDLGALVYRATGLPTRIENDATMALLAEARAHPQGASAILLMLTVGTGIGGAVLANGAPWRGGGVSGQFGHIVVSDTGPPCNCGRSGCVETFSSGPALRRLVAAAGLDEQTEVSDLLGRSDDGDAVCRTVLQAWAAPFRRALETLVAVADPRAVLIGGGLGHNMVRALDLLPPPNGWFGLPVEAARLGDAAGVIGAGLGAINSGARAEGRAG